MSSGRGKMMVEFFSALMLLSVWRYLSCMAEQVSAITLLAAARDLEAFCSPSAAITCRIRSEKVNPTFYTLLLDF